MNTLENDEWTYFCNRLKDELDAEQKEKSKTHDRKLHQLMDEQPRNSTIQNPQFIDDFVCNESNENFTENELQLLNKGLNFTPSTN